MRIFTVRLNLNENKQTSLLMPKIEVKVVMEIKCWLNNRLIKGEFYTLKQ